VGEIRALNAPNGDRNEEEATVFNVSPRNCFAGACAALFLMCFPGCKGDRATTSEAAGWRCPTERDIPEDIDQRVRELISLTFSEDYSKKEVAARELGELGDRAIPAVPFLIRLLGGLQEPGAIDACIQAQTSLEKLGSMAVPDLVRALEDDHWERRKQIILVLDRIGDVTAVGPIIATLRDPHPEVRRWAAFALGNQEMRDNGAVEALIQLLSDPGDDVARMAAKALAKIADTRALEPLAAVAGDARRDEGVRVIAISALGLIGDHRPVPQLLAIAGDGDEDAVIRASAARALGALGEQQAFAYLEDFVTQPSNSRAFVAAMFGLAELADEKSVELLIALLKAPPRGFEPEVYSALVRSGDPAAIEAVISAVEAGGTQMPGWIQAIDVLVLSGNPRAYLAAIPALDGTWPGFRSEVLRALVERHPVGDMYEGLAGDVPKPPTAVRDPRIVEVLLEIAGGLFGRDREHALTLLEQSRDPRAATLGSVRPAKEPP